MRVLVLSVLASGCALGVFQKSPPSRPDLALVNARVVDGNGGSAPVEEMTVEITGRRITAIYPSRNRRPATDSIIDMRGLFIMPGLFDSHVHLTIGGRMAPPQQLRLVLEGGVTSVRDMAGLGPALLELGPRAMSDSTLMPRTYFAALVAGPSWFDDARAKTWAGEYPLGHAPWQHAVTDTADLRAIIANAKASGAIAVKIYANLSAQLVQRIAAEAKRQGLRVWSHATVFPASPYDVVRSGVNAISHATYGIWAESDSLPGVSRGSLNASDFSPDPARSARVDSLLRMMRAGGTVLDATLSVLNVRQDNRGALGTDPGRTVAWTRGFVRRAHELGVTMVAGTDVMGPGRDSVPVVHYELEELVTHGGLTAGEAIATATRNAATLLGVESDYGTVSVGKVADLIVVRADPTVDVRNTRRPLLVFKGGRLAFARGAP